MQHEEWNSVREVCVSQNFQTPKHATVKFAMYVINEGYIHFGPIYP